MLQTNYHRASDVDAALAAAREGSDPKYISGGQTLLPTLKQRLAAPSDLIDLRHVPSMKGISVDGDTVRIGAGTTHNEVHTHDELRRAIPALAELAGLIGDMAVRHMGTIGGSIANNDPAADYPGACLALDAVIETDRREVPAADFFTGMFETALADDEIVTAVRFRVPSHAAYEKFRNPASRYAMAGAFVARLNRETRVAVTGAGIDGVFRWQEAEGLLNASTGGLDGSVLMNLLPDEDAMLGDLHASASYRAHLVKVMAMRATERAVASVNGAASTDNPAAADHTQGQIGDIPEEAARAELHADKVVTRVGQTTTTERGEQAEAERTRHIRTSDSATSAGTPGQNGTPGAEGGGIVDRIKRLFN